MLLFLKTTSVAKKTNYAFPVKAKHLKNFRKQHILVETTACGAPCLQRIKVNSEKLRILLLLWFLLCMREKLLECGQI